MWKKKVVLCKNANKNGKSYAQFYVNKNYILPKQWYNGEELPRVTGKITV